MNRFRKFEKIIIPCSTTDPRWIDVKFMTDKLTATKRTAKWWQTKFISLHVIFSFCSWALRTALFRSHIITRWTSTPGCVLGWSKSCREEVLVEWSIWTCRVVVEWFISFCPCILWWDGLFYFITDLVCWDHSSAMALTEKYPSTVTLVLVWLSAV